ncbi:MAG: 50S ribosomal protein L29 [Anaerolineales bacterium]|nr:50S ribosomal protein L29 [Anaerolineales bacterium]
MRATEIRALSTAEIEGKLEDAREELFKLRFQFRTGQLTDFTRLQAARRSVARLATILRERQIAAGLAAQKES